MSSTPSERKAQAEQLKAEGNRLHLRGDHTAAYEKYSKAIEVDGQNAVLYANRAAASLAMKDYLDAAFDAQKAVKIDPAYAKAWARLAKASHELRVYDKSIGAWDKAISCLPESGLPDSQLKFRQQCVDGLKATREMQMKVRERATRVYVIPQTVFDEQKLPWQIALSMEDNLTRDQTFESSAWVIMNAWRDFSEGVRIMKLSRPSPAGVQKKIGPIDCICNGILRDPRVFYMDSPNWLELFNIQVAFETGLLEGWSEGGAGTIQAEAVNKLEREGWESVRWALSNTVRTMFLKAYFLDYSGDSVETAIQFYDHAISILEWGAEKWHDVPMSDRGVIFEKTFIRCVKRMRMEAYRKFIKDSRRGSEDDLNKLMAMAAEMIQETTANPPGSDYPGDKGTWFSFWVYPVADALATIGSCYMDKATKARRQRAGGPNASGHVEELFRLAASHYTRAAQKYPEDDEMHPYFLMIAFQARWHRGEPLRQTTSLCVRIRTALEKAEKIWRYSPFWENVMLSRIAELEDVERKATEGLLEGAVTLDTPSSAIRIQDVR